MYNIYRIYGSAFFKYMQYIRKAELTGTATSVCLLQTETGNGSLFSLVSKREMVIDVCCVSKCARLCVYLPT